jgi:hypothetical protein
MTDELGHTILQRFDRMKARKDLYTSLLQECADYVLPLIQNIATSSSEGTKPAVTLYDSTAIHANELLAARLHGTMMSPAVKWFQPATADDDLNEDRDVSAWFEQAEQEMRLQLNLSNFHAMSHEVCLEAPALGTSSLYEEERLPRTAPFDGVNFRAFSVAEIVLDEDADGQVDTLMRLFSLTARSAAGKWPKGKKGIPGLSDEVYDWAKEKPETPVEIVHAMYRRTDGKLPTLNQDGTIKPVSVKQLPYASCYVEKKTKRLIEESGFHEQPFGCIRWALAPGEIYGRGPGATALADIRTLNKSVELFLQQWALAIQPPYWARQRSVFGKPQMLPGQQMVCRNPDDIKEFITQARFDVTMAGIENLRKSVRDMFFSAQLELKQSPEMTATEVSARMALMAQFLGPTAGRYMSEFLTPILVRHFGILMRAKRFLPMPPKLLDYYRRHGEWNIRYLTPMARQQRNPELAAIERYANFLNALLPMYENAKDGFDFERVTKTYAEVAGVPPSVLPTVKEITAKREARIQAAEETAKVSQLGAITEGAKNVAPLVKALQPQNGGA